MNESELRTRSMSSQPDANKPVRIVELKQTDTDAAAHIHLVAARMRQTLIEVLGQERGSAMYSLPWLVDRVEFHLDPARSTGAVLLALDGRDAAVIGHTIVRVEVQEECPRLGLFSTIYVVPEKRRAGVARALVAAGETWLLAHHVHALATNTDKDNVKLIRLFEGHGYQIAVRTEEMVQLRRDVAAGVAVDA